MVQSRVWRAPVLSCRGSLNTHVSDTHLLDVTIIASEFPKDEKNHADYASPKAGAHWRSFCDEDDTRSKGKRVVIRVTR